MKDSAARLPYALAVIGGVAYWTLAAALTDRSEPWDAPSYWSTAYPLAIVLAAVLGFLYPERPWRWAVVLIFTQLVVMVFNGSGLGLLPLGMLLLGVLSLPAVAAAALAARLRLRAGVR